MTDKLWTLPAAIKIEDQIFHVPGLVRDGGITTGGVRNNSPEPGGYGRLEFKPALAVNEWGNPWASWLMSKTAGQIIKVQLALTPQIATARSDYKGEITLTKTFSSGSAKGTDTVYIDMSGPAGELLQPGHVIGHDIYTYMIDEINYNTSGVATIKVTPPLRKAIVTGNSVLFRPYFCGQIANTGEIVNLYQRSMNGSIDIPRIILNEVIPGNYLVDLQPLSLV